MDNLNLPEYTELNIYSVYVKSKKFIFKDYFLFITNKHISNIEDNLIIKNINHDLAILIYNYIKNKYGKIKFEIGRTNELILKYEDIKNIFYDIQNDIMINNLSKYKNNINDKNRLVLTRINHEKNPYYNHKFRGWVNYKNDLQLQRLNIHDTYLYLCKKNEIMTSILTRRNVDEYEIIYKYWNSNDSYLIYHYMIQNNADKKSNKLNLTVEEATSKIDAFFENISSKEV